MKFTKAYQSRPIRFLELHRHQDWLIKIYSISSVSEKVDPTYVNQAKLCLSNWLAKSKDYPLETYNIATLILHECKEGCFAVIQWWIDENMLQNNVYLKRNHASEWYSQNGMATCVWELAIWWHERNAWVRHILMQHQQPHIEAYLKDTLKIDI